MVSLVKNANIADQTGKKGKRSQISPKKSNQRNQMGLKLTGIFCTMKKYSGFTYFENMNFE